MLSSSDLTKNVCSHNDNKTLIMSRFTKLRKKYETSILHTHIVKTEIGQRRKYMEIKYNKRCKKCKYLGF